MIRFRLALATALFLAASSGCAAGLKFIRISGDTDNPAIDAAIWSPCATPPTEVKIGALAIPATPDCPIAGEELPLIIISHG